MNPDTKTALEASIKHWEENVAAHPSEMRVYADDCALCQRFMRQRFNYSAIGGENNRCRDDSELCPVHAKTGKTMCRGTPWEAVLDAISVWSGHTGPEEKAARAKVVRRAKKMLKFLEDLREPEEGKL